MIFSLCKKAGLPLTVAGLLLFSFLLGSPTAVHSGELAVVRDVRHWENPDFVRFVFELSAPVEFTTGRLSNPDRLFMDLKRVRITKGIRKSIEVDHPAIKSMRLGQYSAETARIVFDIKCRSYNFKVINLEDPARLVIDIFPEKDKGKGKHDMRAETKNDDTSLPPRSLPKPEARTQTDRLIKKTVVIDAGHGGHDPGAIGPTGLYEKNVVLDIAIKVRDIMKKDYPSYNIVLTRESDVFIPLPQRAEIANNNNADLFVSVHANSSTNQNARGIETYLLNWSNDAEALKVAARENAISVKKMKQMKSELGVILASLERESKRDESVKVAGNIQTSLSSAASRRYPEVNDLGVKQALFYVLVGAKMPSTLVEVSFVSNPKEEKLLASDAYRQFLAKSIADGIHTYFSSQPLPQVTFEEQGRNGSSPETRLVKHTGIRR